MLFSLSDWGLLKLAWKPELGLQSKNKSYCYWTCQQLTQQLESQHDFGKNENKEPTEYMMPVLIEYID